jgi:hypothetical protein
MLPTIRELDRLIAPSAEPHAVAIDGGTLYVSSRATQRIDVIDRETWKKTGEIDPPGMPWGMTYGGGELIVTCAEPPDDARRIRRYTEAGGFSAAVDCPDDTGSHLALYGGRVLLGQWYAQRLLLLDERGEVERTWNVPHGICGVAVDGDIAYCATTDDEDDGEYWLTRVELSSGAARDVALIPFQARGLAFDGERFWTNYRAGDRIVAFACT